VKLPELGGPAVEVAPLLLGHVFSRGDRSGRIVEVEAYGADDDPASHAYRGATRRNRSMFGAPGTLYVYLIYGMHLCANVTCGPPGEGGAVLIRALAPLTAVEEMWRFRPTARSEDDLCSGPGKLTAALGIEKGDDGLQLLDRRAPVRLEVGIDDASVRIVAGPRIGVSRAAARPWRFAIAGDANVSRPRPR
jgi:DNA-3-methyladenine glycosylase